MVLESIDTAPQLMRDEGHCESDFRTPRNVSHHFESHQKSSALGAFTSADQAAYLLRISATSCLCCRNLDYRLFAKSRRSFRCIVVDFKELRASATAGCVTCKIASRATQIFWGDRPETFKSIDTDRSKKSDMLCYMTRKPGGSLRIFRYNALSYSADPVGWEWAYLMSIELFTDGGKIYHTI